MTTNLGQLLKHIEVLDEAASRAPLDRNATLTVMNTSQTLRAAVQEVYKAASANSAAKDRLEKLEHSLTVLLSELDGPAREKLTKLLPVKPAAEETATA